MADLDIFHFGKIWTNEVFDGVNSFKKKTRSYFDLNSNRDISKKDKPFRFYSMKIFWQKDLLIYLKYRSNLKKIYLLAYLTTTRVQSLTS